MHLKRLHIHHLRNLAQADLELSPQFNYVYGPNGAGKTALLEAVHVIARGRSFRTHRIEPVIGRGADEMIVRADIASAHGTGHTLAVAKSRRGQTQLRVDGEREVRASSLARHLPVQALLPEAANLVLEGPTGRRAYLDWGLFHVEQRFLDVSRRYRRVLAQRNAWLKQQAIGVAEDDPWLEQLLALGIAFSEMREGYVNALRPLFETVLSRLTDDLTVGLDYDWGGLNSATEAAKKMSESLSRDVKLGLTHRGPHRGDLTFTLDEGAAAEVVSRGQAKLIASGAILAQAKLMQQLRQDGTTSVFLIDDFGAELDATHWQQFLETLLSLECQVIATSTQPLDLKASWVQALGPSGVRVFHVEHGEFSVR